MLFSLVSLTYILIDSDRAAEAIGVARQAVALSEKLDNPDPVHRANSAQALGTALLEAGDGAAAEPLLRNAWQTWQAGAVNDRRRMLAESALGACLTVLGHYDEAEPLLLESNQTIKADPGASDINRRRSLERLAGLFEKSGRVADGAAVRQRLSEIGASRGERARQAD